MTRRSTTFEKTRSANPILCLQRDEPPQKVSKLAILAETEEDRYDTATTVICYECQEENSGDLGDRLSAVVDGVMKALSFTKREEVKAWEQEFIPCEHILRLIQQDNKDINGNGKETLVPKPHIVRI